MKQLVEGHGLNDADYTVNPTINGKQTLCPYYRAWKNMLTRVYSSSFHKRRPTYIQCTIDPDWLFFSVFKEWMENRNWKNKHLDKDLIAFENKHYSPENCCFVSLSVNNLLCTNDANGITFDKRNSKFRAKITIDNKSVHLGRYNSKEQAIGVYNMTKAGLIAIIAKEEFSDSPAIYEALMRHAKRYIGYCF